MSGASFLLALVTLSPGLQQWQQEIASATGATVQLFRLQPDQMKLPPGTAGADLAEPYLRDPGFRAQFARAQALSLLHGGVGQPKHFFVFLNERLVTPGPDEETVISHEFGHLHLKAQRYPAPTYQPGPSACLYVYAGDAVQHILIRKEMDARKVAWRQPTIQHLEAAMQRLQTDLASGAKASRPERCQQLETVLLWIDTQLGLTNQDWAKKAEFLALLRKRFPLASQLGDRLAAQLEGVAVADKGLHREALSSVFQQMKEFALSLPL